MVDKTNKRQVSLQEETTPRALLPPTAAALWRQSRNLLASAKKTAVQADWLENLNQDKIMTPWAAGLAPLLSYCLDDNHIKEEIVEIRKRAALEIQAKTSDHLREKSERDRQHSMRVLGTAEDVSGQNPAVIMTAIQTSANMVGRGKAELIKDLRERKTHLGQRQLTDADWLNIDKLTNPPTFSKATFQPPKTKGLEGIQAAGEISSKVRDRLRGGLRKNPQLYLLPKIH